MKNLICDSEPLVLQEELVVSSANVDTNQAFAYLEIQISGRPVSHALISIDDIRKTAICGPCGKVSLNNLNSGKYLLDIISPGFIAQTISLNIHASGSYELEVKMISNI